MPRKHRKHDEGERPYVLFLGTAASLSSGCSTLSDTAKGIIGSDDPVTFFDFLDRHTYRNRANLLREYLRGHFPSPDYHYLAQLVRIKNVSQPWLYGNAEIRSAKRPIITGRLNKSALSVLAVFPNELCNLTLLAARQGQTENPFRVGSGAAGWTHYDFTALYAPRCNVPMQPFHVEWAPRILAGTAIIQGTAAAEWELEISQAKDIEPERRVDKALSTSLELAWLMYAR